MNKLVGLYVFLPSPRSRFITSPQGHDIQYAGREGCMSPSTLYHLQYLPSLECYVVYYALYYRARAHSSGCQASFHRALRVIPRGRTVQ
jgi:hypothetical protein